MKQRREKRNYKPSLHFIGRTAKPAGGPGLTGVSFSHRLRGEQEAVLVNERVVETVHLSVHLGWRLVQKCRGGAVGETNVATLITSRFFSTRGFPPESTVRCGSLGVLILTPEPSWRRAPLFILSSQTL